MGEHRSREADRTDDLETVSTNAAQPTPGTVARQRLPVAPPREAVQAVLARLEGDIWLIAMLAYGSGLRLREALALRIADLDLRGAAVRVRSARGATDRRCALPRELLPHLEAHASMVEALYREDVAVEAIAGCRHGWPEPAAHGGAATGSSDLCHLFPSHREPKPGRVSRARRSEPAVRSVIRRAAREAGAPEVSCRSLRNTFLIEQLAAGASSSDLQRLLGLSRQRIRLYRRLLAVRPPG